VSALRASPFLLPVMRLVVLLMGAVSISGTAQGVLPKPIATQDLTVPKDRLPNGCILKTIQPPGLIPTSESGRQTIHVTGPTPSLQPPGVTTNPWIGTDRRTLAWLRQRVDGYGSLRLPDGPPLSASEAAAMSARFADGVDQGYAATYVQSTPRDLAVHAVRFAAAPEKPLDLSRDRTYTLILDIGLIRVGLLGDNGPCSTAIETYLRSLGK
jgi:hypothetical protein